MRASIPHRPPLAEGFRGPLAVAREAWPGPFREAAPAVEHLSIEALELDPRGRFQPAVTMFPGAGSSATRACRHPSGLPRAALRRGLRHATDATSTR